MKKQITVIASVALAAVLLFTSYIVFFKDDGIEEASDPFYTLTDDVKVALSEIDTKVEILLSNYDANVENWEMIFRYSEVIAASNKKISLETSEEGEFDGVAVITDNGKEEIPLDSFFKTLYDGTQYAFDGESLISNAIFSLCGKDEKEISLRALSGYDVDGDQVTATGAPFIFPSLQRSNIAFLTIKNSHGEYSIYKDEGDFYFGSSRAVSYNDELFSQLTTNCRYAVAYGKMELPEDTSWSKYGLDEKDPTTASYTIMSDSDSNGNYFLHTVYIGDLSSTGSYYYARYIGGLFKPSENKDEGDQLVHNLSKSLIYFLPVDTVDGSIALPETAVMEPTIVNPISNNEQMLTIDNIRIDLFGDGVSAIAKNMLEFNAADNLSAIDMSSITDVIGNKISVDNYSAYSDGWQKHIDVFGGFTSSNGKATYIEAALTRAAKNGEYRVKFGLLRDEAGGAYLPSKVTISKSYDGNNWHAIEDGEISISHSDKTIKEYELEFTDENVVKYIKVAFDVPQKSKTYVVFDEIRIYADGEDAQPVSAIGGQWKLTAPNEYIAEGMNYSYLDMTNFNDFVQSLTQLSGESVVACGFADNGDATSLDTELLDKYGLKDPDKHFAFEYQGVVTDLYVSALNENGKYYAYSTFKGELNGVKVNATTDVIVEISAENAPWLGWDIVEYLDHSLFSIFLVDISEMEITVDGKTYDFKLSLDADGNLSEVELDGENYDVKSFKYLYQSIISIKMQTEYVPSEDETQEEYFRLKVHTETNSPEIVFYRVSSSKCFFTINGQGSYYVLVEDVNEARDRLFAYLDGEILTK